MLCVMIWHGQHGIAKLIRATEDASPVEQRVRDVLADIWHFAAIAYVLAVVALTLVRRLSGEDASAAITLGSMMIVVAIPLLDVLAWVGVPHARSRLSSKSRVGKRCDRLNTLLGGSGMPGTTPGCCWS